MYVIKKINTHKLAKLTAVFSALLGLIPAVFSGIIFLFSFTIGSRVYYGPIRLISSLSFVAIPLFFLIGGYIYGLILGFIYNKLSEYGYNLEIDIEMSPEKK
ncbi:MAG: hypothetical protein NTW06_02525 [Candidatus Falkowbacteria bacterium]|nr:hypothetical protein [Candidatus Falkowbacteria bacterium]